MSRNKVLLYCSGITFGIGYFISWLLLFRNKGFVGFLICNITFAICITLLLFMKPQKEKRIRTVMRKCKYVLLNGFLIKDIVNGKYENIEFEKIGFDRWFMKSGEHGLGIIDGKIKRFVEELVWAIGFLPKENNND